MKKIYFIITVILFIVTGCGSGKPIQSYILNTTPLPPKSYSPYKNRMVQVAYPKGISIVMSDRIYYTDAKLKENYYLYSKWSTTLGRILLKEIIKGLSNSKIFADVVDYQSTIPVSYILEPTVNELIHQVVNENESYAKIDITFRLLGANDNKVIKRCHIKRVIPCPTTNAKGFITALNRGISEVENRLIDCLIK